MLFAVHISSGVLANAWIAGGFVGLAILLLPALWKLKEDDAAENWPTRIPPKALVRLLTLLDEGKISGPIAKQVFEEMWSPGPADPDGIIEKKGLAQVSDSGALTSIIEEVIARHPKEVEGYKNGKAQLLGFFVGQVMKASGGKANPAVVNELLKKKLAN